VPAKRPIRYFVYIGRVYLIGTIAVVCACCAAIPAAAAPPVLIGQLKIVGAQEVGRSEIRKVISTNAPSFFSFLPLVKLPVFDKAVIDDDMGRIVNLYQSYGYYHGLARYTLETGAGKKSARVVIIVTEGRPTRINSVRVDIVSGEEAAIRPALGGAVLLRQGEIFRIELYDRTRERMENFFANNGYAAARVTGRVAVDKQKYLADVTFTVTTGPLQFFGPVVVEGNSSVRKEDILRELAFKENVKFSRNSLMASQRNIYRLGLFNSVVLSPKTEGGRDVPVNIRVDEKERRSFTLGLGYGSEDKIRTQATWIRRYLWDKPRTLAAAVRYSAIMFSGALDITQLYFIDRFSSLGIHGGYEREYFVSYSNERISSQARVGRTFGNNVEGFISYQLEVNRPVSVSRATLLELTETRPGDYYFISGMLFGLRRDTVKDNLNPASGSTVSIYFEPSTFLLGSKLDYVRAIGEGRVYYPLAGENVLATRLKVGFIEPSRFTRDIPIFKRFFSGGSNSVRGYAFQSLGPLDAAGIPIGGDYLVEANLEVRYPVYREFRGVIFVDGGNVYRDRPAYSLAQLKYSAGLGARYITVVGPIRFDVAFPLEPFPELDFNRYVLYVSLGNTF